MKGRRGFSLVETLVTLSAASVVLTLSTVAIHRAMRASSVAQAFHDDESTAWRLASIWRADIGNAHNADVTRDRLAWRVELSQRDAVSTRYTFAGELVTREEQRGDPIARESYTFSRAQVWKIGSPTDAGTIVLQTLQDDSTSARNGRPLGLHWVTRLERPRVGEVRP